MTNGETERLRDSTAVAFLLEAVAMAVAMLGGIGAFFWVGGGDLSWPWLLLFVPCLCLGGWVFAVLRMKQDHREEKWKARWSVGAAVVLIGLVGALLMPDDSDTASQTPANPTVASGSSGPSLITEEDWRDEQDFYGAFKAACFAAVADLGGWDRIDEIDPDWRMEASTACVADGRVEVFGESIRNQQYSVLSWFVIDSLRVDFLVFVEQTSPDNWQAIADTEGLPFGMWQVDGETIFFENW